MEATTNTYQPTASASLATPVVVARRKDIPEAPLYITAIIPHLSGWGEAEGKTTRGIYPVPNHDTASKVTGIIRSKLNGQRIHTCATRPEIRNASMVNVVFDYRGLL